MVAELEIASRLPCPIAPQLNPSLSLHPHPYPVAALVSEFGRRFSRSTQAAHPHPPPTFFYVSNSPHPKTPF